VASTQTIKRRDTLFLTQREPLRNQYLLGGGLLEVRSTTQLVTRRPLTVNRDWTKVRNPLSMSYKLLSSIARWAVICPGVAANMARSESPMGRRRCR
jgi:hypothetical protein